MSEMKKVFRPYVAASVNSTERWLTAMAEDGCSFFENQNQRTKNILCIGVWIEVRLHLIII